MNSKKLLVLALLAALVLAVAGVALAGRSSTTTGINGQVRGQVCITSTKICYFTGIPNLYVLLSGSGHTYKQTVTGKNGRFSFAVKPGTYYLVVSDGHGHSLSPTTDAIKLKSGRVNLTLFLAQKLGK
jgi:hypothetical protein